jgi:hypothetical protein
MDIDHSGQTPAIDSSPESMRLLRSRLLSVSAFYLLVYAPFSAKAACEVRFPNCLIADRR